MAVDAIETSYIIKYLTWAEIREQFFVIYVWKVVDLLSEVAFYTFPVGVFRDNVFLPGFEYLF